MTTVAAQLIAAGDPSAILLCMSAIAAWGSGVLLLVADPALDDWRGRAGLLMGLGLPGLTLFAVTISLVIDWAFG